MVRSAPLSITGLAHCVAKAIYRGEFATKDRVLRRPIRTETATTLGLPTLNFR